jgi:hypothetical protein
MQSVRKNCIVWLVSLGALALNNGCSDEEASAEVQRELEMVRLEAKRALEMAQQAFDMATLESQGQAAQACCDANTERLDRMYARIVGKEKE